LTFLLFPALVGWESHNKYQIKNTLGQQVYFAAEGNVFNSNSVTLNFVSLNS